MLGTVGNINIRPFVPPAPGTQYGKLGNSISDGTVGMGVWAENVAAHFGWNLENENMFWNTSLETNTQDWFASSNCTIAQSAVQAFHGTKSGLVTSSAAGFLTADFCGPQAPALASTISGGAVTGGGFSGQAGGGLLAPTITFGGPGTGATAAIGINAAGQIDSFLILTGGTGYTVAPTVTLSGIALGTGYVLTATVAAGAVTGITINNAGSAFIQFHPVVLSGGGGTGAVLIAQIDNSGVLRGLRAAAGGTGYTSAPAATLTVMRPLSQATYGLQVAAVAGQQYTYILRAFFPTAGSLPIASSLLQVMCFDATGAFVGVNGPAASGATNAWLTMHVTFTVPANAVQVWVRFASTAGAAAQTVFLDGAQMVKGTYIPAIYTDYTERGGIAGSTLSNKVGASVSAQNTMATRITKHTGLGVILMLYGVNDLGQMGGGSPLEALADVSTALDTVFTAINGMTTPPLVVVVGLFEFFETVWGTSAPAGSMTFHDQADKIAAIHRQKAAQYGAVYVNVRSRIQPKDYYVQPGNVHPNNAAAHQLISDAVIATLEGRTCQY